MPTTTLSPVIHVTFEDVHSVKQGEERTKNNMDVNVCGDSQVGENKVSVVDEDNKAGCTDYGIGRSGSGRSDSTNGEVEAVRDGVLS
jgi:hypothetical protein